MALRETISHRAIIGSATDYRPFKEDLATCLLDLGATLADFKFWVALADHVDSAASFDDLAVGVTVFESTNAADNFHRIVFRGRIV